MKKCRSKYLIEFSKTAIIAFLCCCPLDQVWASYIPVDGRVSYLAGVMASTNFQETLFNNNDTQSKLGRSQSFALLFQGLGDLNSKASLMAETTIGIHKFCKEAGIYLDDYTLEGISFDLGYRRNIGGDFWMSGEIGSLYPWRVTQKINSRPNKFDDSEFSSIYSLVLGIQYESQWGDQPISYDLRIRKYMSGQVDDQMAIGFMIGFRFNSN